MPYRQTVLATGEIYHILNRGVAQTPIFLTPKEYWRFLDLVEFYRHHDLPLSYSRYARLSKEEKDLLTKELKSHPVMVEIYAFCLMPNHFHFLLKQVQEKGIQKMFTNLQNGYAKYFNLKRKRRGPLFQSVFKAKRIITDEQFLHVSRYIHLNPSSSYLTEIKDLLDYPWFSLREYLGKQVFGFVETSALIKLIGNQEKYKKFVFDQADYQRELDTIKHLVLEED